MVFISWAGEPSRQIGTALQQLIALTVQNAKPWMSHEDILAGSDWSDEVRGHLKVATFGVLCLTPDNIDRPWVLYEAGAIGEKVGGSRVCPMIYGMSVDALRYPLKRFQAKPLTQPGVWDLVRAIHQSTDPPLLTEAQLRVSFDAHWPAFELAIRGVETTVPAPEPPDTAEVMRGIAQDLRLIKQAVETFGAIPVQRVFELGRAAAERDMQASAREALEAPWLGKSLGELMNTGQPSDSTGLLSSLMKGAKAVNAPTVNVSHQGSPSPTRPLASNDHDQ